MKYWRAGRHPAPVVAAVVLMCMQAVFCTAPATAEKPLLSYVPAGGRIVVSVNLEKLMAASLFRDAAKDMKLDRMPFSLVRPEKYGIELQLHEICRQLVFSGAVEGYQDILPRFKQFSLVIRTGLPENAFREALDAAADSLVFFTREQKSVGEHRVYLLMDGLAVIFHGAENDPTP